MEFRLVSDPAKGSEGTAPSPSPPIKVFLHSSIPGRSRRQAIWSSKLSHLGLAITQGNEPERGTRLAVVGAGEAFDPFSAEAGQLLRQLKRTAAAATVATAATAAAPKAAAAAGATALPSARPPGGSAPPAASSTGGRTAAHPVRQHVRQETPSVPRMRARAATTKSLTSTDDTARASDGGGVSDTSPAVKKGAAGAAAGGPGTAESDQKVTVSGDGSHANEPAVVRKVSAATAAATAASALATPSGVVRQPTDQVPPPPPAWSPQPDGAYALASASGVLLVSDRWLVDCTAAQRLLDPVPYDVRAPPADPLYKVPVPVSASAAVSRPSKRLRFEQDLSEVEGIRYGAHLNEGSGANGSDGGSVPRTGREASAGATASRSSGGAGGAGAGHFPQGEGWRTALKVPLAEGPKGPQLRPWVPPRVGVGAGTEAGPRSRPGGDPSGPQVAVVVGEGPQPLGWWDPTRGSWVPLPDHRGRPRGEAEAAPLQLLTGAELLRVSGGGAGGDGGSMAEGPSAPQRAPAEGSTAVAASPTSPALASMVLTHAAAGGAVLRVVSYNVLGNTACVTTFSGEARKMSPYFREMSYRGPRLLQELRSYNADVICLQEVDASVFQLWLHPWAKIHGYKIKYLPRGATCPLKPTEPTPPLRHKPFATGAAGPTAAKRRRRDRSGGGSSNGRGGGGGGDEGGGGGGDGGGGGSGGGGDSSFPRETDGLALLWRRQRLDLVELRCEELSQRLSYGVVAKAADTDSDDPEERRHGGDDGTGDGGGGDGASGDGATGGGGRSGAAGRSTQRLYRDGPFWQSLRNRGVGTLLALLRLRGCPPRPGDSGDKADRTFVVGTTHIWWDPRLPDVKVGETHLLCEAAAEFVSKAAARSGMRPEDVPLVLCGDWNTRWLQFHSDRYDTVTERGGCLVGGVYELLTRGSLDEGHPHHPVSRRGAAAAGVEMHTSGLRLASSHLVANGREPAATVISHNFRACLDYIWLSRGHWAVSATLGMPYRYGRDPSTDACGRGPNAGTRMTARPVPLRQQQQQQQQQEEQQQQQQLTSSAAAGVMVAHGGETAVAYGYSGGHGDGRGVERPVGPSGTEGKLDDDVVVEQASAEGLELGMPGGPHVWELPLMPNAEWPSDHFAVGAELVLLPPQASVRAGV